MDLWWRWQLQGTAAFVPRFRAFVGLSHVHYKGDSHNLEQPTSIALYFHLLEYSHVGLVSILLNLI